MSSTDARLGEREPASDDLDWMDRLSVSLAASGEITDDTVIPDYGLWGDLSDRRRLEVAQRGQTVLNHQAKLHARRTVLSPSGFDMAVMKDAFPPNPRFETGTIVVHPAVADRVPLDEIGAALRRHQLGEFEGSDDLERALAGGIMISSRHTSDNGTVFEVSTTGDRQNTSVFLK